MARLVRRDHVGAFHHGYQRGNGRQTIFRDDADYELFLKLVLRFRDQFGVVILAYCLMPNHFHLVLESLKAQLSLFMKRLEETYARIHNDKHRTVGHLFQGRFQSRLCTNVVDVRGVVRYVHLNPVEATLVTMPEDWPWSSHRGVLAGVDPIADVPRLLELFDGAQAYKDFLAEARPERRALEEIALELFGPGWRSLLAGPRRDAASVEARRRMVIAGRHEGHRPSDLARFLSRTPAAVTWLLKRGD